MIVSENQFTQLINRAYMSLTTLDELAKVDNWQSPLSSHGRMLLAYLRRRVARRKKGV